MSARKPLTFRIRAELYSQLAQIEVAGLPFDRALNVLQLAEPAQSRLLAMRALIKHHDFALAGEQSGLFSKLEARLIHASTNAGSPARMYRQLADFYSTRARQAATMKSRMLMPAGVFMLALAIQPLPGLVSGSMGVSAYLYQVLRPMIPVALVVFGVRWWLSRPAATASQKTASPWRSIPLFDKLIVRRNVRDFFASLGLMLEAGIPLLDALPLALDTIAEHSIKREFSRIAPRVAGGATLAQAIADSAFLGGADSRERAVALIDTGEQSGTLPEMLLRHTTMESITIDASFEQLATWAPRVVYELVMLWMIGSLLTYPGLMPRAIADL